MTDQNCYQCGEAIQNGRGVWLEMNLHSGRFSNPDGRPLPGEDSQGVFCFGETCAARVLSNGGEIDEGTRKTSGACLYNP